MTDKDKTFLSKYNYKIVNLLRALIDERTEMVLNMTAGDERDRQIEFIKAFREWLIVLGQFDPETQKTTIPKEAI